jgi:hypothetical protein
VILGGVHWTKVRLYTPPMDFREDVRAP